MEYNFRDIEQKWQKRWKENGTYRVSNDSAKPKYYVLDMFPYPSGAGLHVGHPLGYIASDIYARYKRLKGFNVLHPMGFDSFGLPAEQYAIETGQHPADTTAKNIDTFKQQLDKIGFCYDWEREVRTSDPQYYKWTQWIFLQLFNSYFCNTQQKARPISDLIEKYETRGSKDFTAAEWKLFSEQEKAGWLMKRRLAFSAYGEVNWCEALGTVLANDEVINGVSERGGHPVIRKKMRQWYLRITAYADRLLEGLETVEFSDAMKEMQRNWIGKSEGANLKFEIAERGEKLEVYTTRPDTIFGVDFMVVAPEHEIVNKIVTEQQHSEIENYLTYVKSRSERERMAEVKQVTGAFTGAFAINPFDGKKIPVYIAEYVLAGYGTGAIMAVPCGDQRDFLFAKHFNIPVTNIIGEYYNGEEANPTKDAVLQNSGFLNGLLMKDAIAVAIDKIEELGIGLRKKNYKMRDAGFSRQRYWGEPFPIVWKEEVAYALNENDLPLELPHVDKYGPGPEGEGPLANITEWVELVDLTPNPSPEERGTERLTPNPSPDERGTEHPRETIQSANDKPGYIHSTEQEWRNTLAFAKDNRRNATLSEDMLWQRLRNRQVEATKFRRQHPMHGYIPDFVCLEKNLIVEVDGGYHLEEDQQKFDKAREAYLQEFGLHMLRFTDAEVENNVSKVIETIASKLKELPSVAESSSSPLPGRGVGGEVKRETSTMPGYAGSSWYFLRYMDPHNAETFCDKKVSDYWNQVDVYVGGTEHAVGHLLYSRMWTKFLYDRGWISYDEPFKRLVNQGMIQGSSRFVYRLDYFQLSSGIDTSPSWFVPKSLFISYNKVHEFIASNESEKRKFINAVCKKLNTEHIEKDITGLLINPLRVDVNSVDGIELNINQFVEWRNTDGTQREFIFEEDGKFLCGIEVEKMSKSKYNTVNPDELCDKYGADTFRMYEMFLGPVEQSKPWDTKGIEGVHRFLRKLWRLFFDEIKGPIWTAAAP
ncbi:MAG: class I tRNA ligase family protein, partial [Ferruginibacter sp.]